MTTHRPAACYMLTDEEKQHIVRLLISSMYGKFGDGNFKKESKMSKTCKCNRATEVFWKVEYEIVGSINPGVPLMEEFYFRRDAVQFLRDCNVSETMIPKSGIIKVTRYKRG